MNSHQIEDFAQDPNWIRFGKSLSQAMQNPRSYGFTGSEELIAEVAHLRGVDPASLRNPLTAVTWMKDHAPKAIDEENPRLAMTGVLLLAQISILDSGLADEIGPKFFSGDVTRAKLKATLATLREGQVSHEIDAHHRYKRAADFEERVFEFLLADPSALGLGSDVTVARSPRQAVAPSDFVVLRDGKAIAAIEVKSHRQKLHHRYLVEALAMTSISAKAYERAFLIVPEQWGNAVSRIEDLISSLNLGSLQCAVFSEVDGGRLKVIGDHVYEDGSEPTDGEGLATETENWRAMQPGMAEEGKMTDRRETSDQVELGNQPKLAAANFQKATNRIVELEPAIVHSAGVKDRMDGGLQDIDALAASIRAVGQKVPILVRPHRDREGEYEIVAGRRRLEACRVAGLRVRAEVQALDEKELVVSQVVENIAREDLTYVERARIAVRMVDEIGLPQQSIEDAFCCGKTDRSRFLKIGRGVPEDILSWVGKAPSIGRPRWEKLVRALLNDGEAEERIRSAITSVSGEAANLSSDQRFTCIWEAAIQPRKPDESDEEPEDLVSVDGYDAPVARLRRSPEGLEITLFKGSREGLLEWVEENQSSLIQQIIRLHERDA
ncbi:plasmid partitioning protein RepB [Sulfitobacter dubius]|uniref:plasmid partitioning protein RepB n=1 Tax=Sulfitobacter dubius TaxID=218673 RepID=UPI0022AEF103|nr:plasmid partitioning protein RepB [Sulfitobacter dubius]MCZ4365502.1 plasmid partitioning protein RepB [Sulfitobacter dubius]